MRWDNSQPKHGDTRTQERFLWVPKTIRGETRWLERARWEERFEGRFAERMPLYGPYWKETRWLAGPLFGYRRGGSVSPAPPTGPPTGEAPKPLNTSGKAA